MTGIAIRQQRFTHPSVAGGMVAAASWAPAQPRAILLVIHGHKESLARYELLITDLVQAGFAVYGQDHHGHGRSSGARALVPRFDLLVDDLEPLVARARADHPGLPLAVFGHSMGGLVAIRYALRHNDEVAALAVTGPALTIDEDATERERRVGRLLARVAPSAPLPKGNGGDVLSYDPEIGRQFGLDHRNVHRQTRVITAMTMLEAGLDARARASTLTAPLLLLHGADDRLTYPSGSQEFFERASSADKTIDLLPHTKHELLNEAERHATSQRIVDWLATRLLA